MSDALSFRSRQIFCDKRAAACARQDYKSGATCMASTVRTAPLQIPCTPFSRGFSLLQPPSANELLLRMPFNQDCQQTQSAAVPCMPEQPQPPSAHHTLHRSMP
eukprot:751858-Hanusia_phi.AAC.3